MSTESSELTAPLTRFERTAVALGRFANESERAKKYQLRYTQNVTNTWVKAIVSSRVYVDNIDWIYKLEPERGVMFVANHRSFFDMYSVMLVLYTLRTPWLKRVYFPVRANFFYEHPAGIAINFAVGGGAMYPPIFRDKSKAELTKDAIERVIGFLAEPGTLVGLHPEGTRGKGPSPYELLPAQPGAGQIALRAKPIVVPFFINGLPNQVGTLMRDTFRSDARKTSPIIICAGNAFDYSDLAGQTPRVALYKRCADRMHEAILNASVREREIRAACGRGDIADSDGGWLLNAARRLRG